MAGQSWTTGLQLNVTCLEEKSIVLIFSSLGAGSGGSVYVYVSVSNYGMRICTCNFLLSMKFGRFHLILQ